MSRNSSGSLFAAVGAQAYTSDAVLGGMMEKLHSTAVAKHAAAAAALATFKKIEAQAKAVQALSKVDEDLSGDELMKLLRWKMPSGSSKLKDKSSRLAKWKEVAGLPDPTAPEVTEMRDLPLAAELGRIKARMEARAGTAAAADPPPAPPPPPLRRRLLLPSTRIMQHWKSWTLRWRCSSRGGSASNARPPSRRRRGPGALRRRP